MTYKYGRKGASLLAWENLKNLLGLIHNLFTCVLLIRRQRVEGKIRGMGRQGK